MNSIEYIQGLRLTDDEKLELHKDVVIVLGLDYDTDIADAQYTKLLVGLIEWLDKESWRDDSGWALSEFLRQLLGKSTTEPSNDD